MDENAPKDTVLSLVAPNNLWAKGTDWVREQQPGGIEIRKYSDPINTPLIRRLRKHEKFIKKQSYGRKGEKRTEYLAQTSHIFILKDELTNEQVKKN